MADVIVCGSDNEICLEALKIISSKAHIHCLLANKQIREGRLFEWCVSENIPIRDEITPSDYGHVRLLLTFTYKKKVAKELIESADIAINFHPAPLPAYRGKGSTSLAILHGEKRWAATCHYLTEKFDQGGIIKERWFDITDDLQNGYDLSRFSWRVSLQMLNEMLDGLLSGESPESHVPTGESHYYNMQYLEEQKEVLFEDSAKKINLKIDALWFPPFEGAYIEREGQHFYLINDRLMREISELYERVSLLDQKR